MLSHNHQWYPDLNQLQDHQSKTIGGHSNLVLILRRKRITSHHHQQQLTPHADHPHPNQQKNPIRHPVQRKSKIYLFFLQLTVQLVLHNLRHQNQQRKLSLQESLQRHLMKGQVALYTGN